MVPNGDSQELKSLILENQRLLGENNELLKKLHRSNVRHFWFNIAWIVLFFGLPLIALFKVILPFYNSVSPAAMDVSGQLQEVIELKNSLEQHR